VWLNFCTWCFLGGKTDDRTQTQSRERVLHLTAVQRVHIRGDGHTQDQERTQNREHPELHQSDALLRLHSCLTRVHSGFTPASLLLNSWVTPESFLGHSRLTRVHSWLTPQRWTSSLQFLCCDWLRENRSSSEMNFFTAQFLGSEWLRPQTVCVIRYRNVLKVHHSTTSLQCNEGTNCKSVTICWEHLNKTWTPWPLGEFLKTFIQNWVSSLEICRSHWNIVYLFTQTSRSLQQFLLLFIILFFLILTDDRECSSKDSALWTNIILLITLIRCLKMFSQL